MQPSKSPCLIWYSGGAITVKVVVNQLGWCISFFEMFVLLPTKQSLFCEILITFSISHSKPLSAIRLCSSQQRKFLSQTFMSKDSEQGSGNSLDSTPLPDQNGSFLSACNAIRPDVSSGQSGKG